MRDIDLPDSVVRNHRPRGSEIELLLEHRVREIVRQELGSNKSQISLLVGILKKECDKISTCCPLFIDKELCDKYNVDIHDNESFLITAIGLYVQEYEKRSKQDLSDNKCSD